MKYAASTTVSVDKSRSEIEKTLTRYGASQFVYGWKDSVALIGFNMNSRFVRFTLPLPDKGDPAFRKTPGGRRVRNDQKALEEWEKACRQKWRALSLVIKAKLEAVESGITEFEEEFLAHIVLPNGSTVGQFMVPQIEKAYDGRKMPSLLPFLEKG